MTSLITMWTEDLTKLARKTPLYSLVETWRNARDLVRWERGERHGAAPHLLKRRVVREYGLRFGLETLVETGTYLGAMVDATQSYFRRVISIELDKELADRARARFRACDNVEILIGDSARELSRVLATLRQPALFWLDAHYSGGITARSEVDTPIESELRLVLEDRNGSEHVVLIDDARHFDGTRDYPTVERIRSLVRQLRPQHAIEVADDIIRVHA